MSFAGACKCPREFLRVVDRNCNHSSFNGRHYTPSDYSSITCLCCGTYYRSKANYVNALRDVGGERWGEVSFHNSGCTHGSYKRSP